MYKKCKPSYFVVWFTKLTGALGALLFFKPKVYYVNKKSQGRRLKGANILMSNHVKLMDFILYMLIFFDRNIRFQMAEVLFRRNKLLSWLLHGLGGIYVDRKALDFGFVAESLNQLDQGKVVGVFPQGRLPVDGCWWEYKPSIVFMALRTDAPIIPMFTDGNYGLFKRTHVIIGEKIYLRDYYKGDNPTPEEMQQLTEMLQQKSLELGEELKRRIKTMNAPMKGISKQGVE